MLRATDDFFHGIHPDSYVEVWWDNPKLRPWDGYGRRGVVFLVTRNYIAVRGPAGYVFCVGRHHVASGTKVRLVGGSEAQCSGSQSKSQRTAKIK